MMKILTLLFTLFSLIHATIKDAIAERKIEVGEKIGSGSFGEVYEAFDRKLKSKVAVKIAYDQFKETENERWVQEKLSKEKVEHCVVAIQYFRLPVIFPHGPTVVFEMPLMDGDLEYLIKLNERFDIRQLKSIAYQILKGIKSLHDHNLVHNDIKPQNILYKQDNNGISYYITDYSVTKASTDKKICHSTPGYEAPEIIMNYENTKASDIWSFGVLLLEVYTKQPLFHYDDIFSRMYRLEKLLGQKFPENMMSPFIKEHMRQKFYSKKLKFPNTVEINYYKLHFGSALSLEQLFKQVGKYHRSELFEDLIKKCLRWNPYERITADQALEHAFFD